MFVKKNQENNSSYVTIRIRLAGETEIVPLWDGDTVCTSHHHSPIGVVSVSVSPANQLRIVA